MMRNVNKSPLACTYTVHKYITHLPYIPLSLSGQKTPMSTIHCIFMGARLCIYVCVYCTEILKRKSFHWLKPIVFAFSNLYLPFSLSLSRLRHNVFFYLHFLAVYRASRERESWECREENSLSQTAYYREKGLAPSMWTHTHREREREMYYVCRCICNENIAYANF